MKTFLRRSGIFFCLLAVAMSFLAIFNFAPAQARGEQGTWVDESTIQLSGGRFSEPVTLRNLNSSTSQTANQFTTTGPITDAQDQCQFNVTATVPVNSPGSASLAFSTNGVSDNCGTSTTGLYDQSVTLSNTAAAATSASTANTNNESEIDCDAGALGWIICPVVNLMAETIDTVSGFLNDYLKVPPLSFTRDDLIYSAWSNVRNIANILFLAAFMFIIYSQATSSMLSNYGVRRTLPRLIAAALFVNLSYFICAFMVDVSNVLGNGVTGIIQSVNNTVTTDNGTGDSLGLTIGTVIAGAGALIVVWFLLLIPVLFTVISTFFVLGFRTAVIVILIIVAPLAFVAWILPNTESFFKKWLQLFMAMLALYPITMAIYAAAVLASNIVRQADGGSTAANVALDIISVVIITLPLFAVPFIFKLSGGFLSRIDAMSRNVIGKMGGDKAEEGITNWRKSKSKEIGARWSRRGNTMAENPENGKVKRRLGRSLAYVGGGRAMREAKRKNREEEAGRMQEDVIASRLLNKDDKLAKKMAGVGGHEGIERARLRAVETAERREHESRKAEENMKSTFGRLSPFAAQAFAESVSSDGEFSVDTLNQRINDKLSKGLINEADVSELKRMSSYGKILTGASMVGAVSSLSQSGFLESDDFVLSASAAIKKQYGANSHESKAILDRMAGAINDGAKNSGSAQHMRWGVVGSELIRNGQDFSFGNFEEPKIQGMLDKGQISRALADQMRSAKATHDNLMSERAVAEQDVRDAIANNNQTLAAHAQERARIKSEEAANVMARVWANVTTELGFQKLPVAAKISRKSFVDDAGKESFAFTMRTNEMFRRDVILTANGSTGDMNAQDRAALLANAKRELVDEAYRREANAEVAELRRLGYNDQARTIEAEINRDFDTITRNKWLELVEVAKDEAGVGNARNAKRGRIDPT